MEFYVVIIAGFGALVLLTAWLPMLMREWPLSLPVICVMLGAAIFAFIPFSAAHPLQYPQLTERITEFAVIIALMGAGLKLDRPFDLRAWAATWHLLVFAMPLTILLLAILGYSLLGLGGAAALLLAAALAPTDPVLASDVQVGPPGQGGEDNVRFTLTSEAGLNDGLAFPFVNLAIALALASAPNAPDDWLARWFVVDVLWKLAAGVGIGWAAGRALGWIMFSLPKHARLARTEDGFVALGVTCLAYGVCEMAHGYGFVAVFVAALGIRAAERNHHYHEKLHDFVEEMERLMTMALLVLFGGALVGGGLLAALNWQAVLFAALAVLVIRPLSAWISLSSSARVDERAVISFFGIRGVGSAYYLAYGLNHAYFGDPHSLWSTGALVILISIVIHGTAATPVMRYIDGRTLPQDEDRAHLQGRKAPSSR